MKLINLLKEIKITQKHPGTLSPQDIEDINLIFGDSYGSGHSGFDLYDPISEQRNQLDYGTIIAGNFEPDEDLEDYPEYQAFLRLVSKPPKAYVSPDIWGLGESPGAPLNAFYLRLEVRNVPSRIDPKHNVPGVDLSSPYSSTGTNQVYVGWFDIKGNYYPNTKYFDEEGNPIE